MGYSSIAYDLLRVDNSIKVYYGKINNNWSDHIISLKIIKCKGLKLICWMFLGEGDSNGWFILGIGLFF